MKKTQGQESFKTTCAKLPKLSITKFDGAFEHWLPFWNKYIAEIDSTELAKEWNANRISPQRMEGDQPSRRGREFESWPFQPATRRKSPAARENVSNTINAWMRLL